MKYVVFAEVTRTVLAVMIFFELTNASFIAEKDEWRAKLAGVMKWLLCALAGFIFLKPLCLMMITPFAPVIKHQPFHQQGAEHLGHTYIWS